ncbi:hypothetical protein [Jiangella aurantiaca]|nr:hypothetical protein [Jiangella aurantiaca]
MTLDAYADLFDNALGAVTDRLDDIVRAADYVRTNRTADNPQDHAEIA